MRRFPQFSTAKWRLAALLTVLAAVLGTADAEIAAAAEPIPVALSALQSFRGSLAYTAHRADDVQKKIVGELSVTQSGFSLDERSDATLLHLSDAQSWLRQGGRTFYFDDPLAQAALANPWAVMLGSAPSLPLGADASGNSWTLGSRMRAYPDGQGGGRLTGLVDLAPGADISFSFDDWENAQGLWLPASVVRFRGGLVDASYVIDSYRVAFAANDRAAAAAQAPLPTQAVQAQPQPPIAASSQAQVWRLFRMLFLLMAGGLAVAAWLRRDALSGHLCRQLARDPRAWRDEGMSAFVSPEGILWFGGCRYHVGAAFYNRLVSVQSSTFFIRVNAPEAGLPLVLARKFPKRAMAQLSRKAAGFTLVEALVAAALFATVVVAAVFPTLIVLARADKVAALHEAAVQVAQNALVDEEAALAYGSSAVATGSTTSQVDGLDLTITVAPASVSGMDLVTATVDDPGGASLARIATMVGPPVPPPDEEPGSPVTR